MTTIPETILVACLDALENGETRTEILLRYPEHAEGLRPFLETAVLLQELPSTPSKIAAELSQKAFLQKAATMKTAVAAKPRSSWRQRLRPVLALALVTLALSATMVVASASSLPGDVLYTTKRYVENVRLSRAADTAERETLLESFEQERVREVKLLLQAKRSAAISFSGPVETIADAQWIINGIPVQVLPDTIITGTKQEGVTAQVSGIVENGTLTAIMITLPDITPPMQQPTATPQPPTVTPVPPTKTPVPPTKTPAPRTPTVTSSPTPTATPVKEQPPTPEVSNEPTTVGNGSGDDENDNGDDAGDSGDDNSGNDNSSNNSNDDGGDENDDNSGSGGGGHSGSGGNENDNTNDNEGENDNSDSGDEDENANSNENENSDHENENSNDDNENENGD